MAMTEEQQSAQATNDDWEQLIEFLSRASSYPERPKQVERIDTHISAVFLTERYVYKLKKRVFFDFLDFRTAASRQVACDEEIRLNRRLAPDVYLGVEGLARDHAGRYHWATSNDEACEWVVKMRRLPQASRLDQLLVKGQLREPDVRGLTQMLLRFYQQLPPRPVRADAYLEQLARHVEGNDLELSRGTSVVPQPIVRRVHDAQRRLLRLWPERWASRVCDGRIVEGHGDLRPEHIYLLPQPVIIDAIEFNAEFRRLDVLDELSFLAVECEMLGAGDWGRQIVACYCQGANDWPAPGVLEFYRSYRACVRAKVALLRSRQATGDEGRQASELSRRYLQVADDVLEEFAQPWLVVVRGRSGTGKSLIATRVAERLVGDLIQTDQLRGELFGDLSHVDCGSTEAFGEGKYAPRRRQEVYVRMSALAAERLAAGRSVILDGTFLQAETRRSAAQLATDHRAKFLEITCHCSDEEARRRIQERLARGVDASEFRPEWLAAQAREENPCDPAWSVCALDTQRSLEELERTLFDTLRSMCHRP